MSAEPNSRLILIVVTSVVLIPVLAAVAERYFDNPLDLLAVELATKPQNLQTASSTSPSTESEGWANAVVTARRYLEEGYSGSPWVVVSDIELRESESLDRSKGAPIDTSLYWVVAATYKAFTFTVLINRQTGNVIDDHVMK